MVHVVAITGSPSHPSRTYGLVEYATQLLQQQEVQTDIISVRDLPAEDLIFGRYDSPALNPAKSLIKKADSLIIATPIYKASYTGVLKSFLDLLPQKALANKVILPIATGGTIAHLLAVEYTLKPVLSELNARYILSSVYAIDKQIQWTEGENLRLDEELEQRIKEALQDLLSALKHFQSTAPELVGIS